MNLQTLIDAIDQLPPDELTQLRLHIDRRLLRPPSPDETPEERIAALHAATEDFFEGFTAEEVEEIVEAMNSKYTNPDDLHTFDWVEELPEDER